MLTVLKWTKIIVFLLLLILYGSFLVHKIDLPAADDLPRQIKIGEEIVHGNWSMLYTNVFSYTEPEYKFYNHHWLSGVAFYLLDSVVGWNGLVIFKTIVLLTAFCLIFSTALKKADFWLVALTSLPVILMLRERTGLRPEVFSYLFIALFLYILVDFDRRQGSKLIYLLIPLQLLWVNMHVFFSIGIMITAGFLFDQIIRNWKNLRQSKTVKIVVFVFVSVVLVSFVNPRGIEGVFYRYPSISLKISENQSLTEFFTYSAPNEDISVALFKPLVGLLVGILLIVLSNFYYERKQNKLLSKQGESTIFPTLTIFYGTAMIATTILGFLILRSLAMFGYIFLLVVPALLNNSFRRAKGYIFSLSIYIWRVSVGFFLCALVLGTLFLLNLSYRGTFGGYEKGIGLTPMSLGGITFFKENNLRGPIFNDADIGSYLIYYLFPKEKVFSDNRFGDAYSSNFWDHVYLPAFADETVWQALLKERNFNVIYLYQYDNGAGVRQFMYNRMSDPEWAFVYGDPFSIIFVRNTPENQDIISKFRITPENAFEKLDFLRKSESEDSVVAAADILNLLNRVDLSRDIFLDVVTKRPENGKIWMIMGEWELAINAKEHSLLAMMYLHKAIDVGQETSEAYSFLGLAYYRVGRTKEALQFLQKSLDLNPDRQDAIRLISAIYNENK